MPTLDVADAFDPSFMDSFIVIRRTEAVNQYGRVVTTEQRFNSTGVVTATGPDDLQRLPEMQYMNKAITIYTRFKIQGPSDGYQADFILWHGSHFIVQTLDDYSGYINEQGFVTVNCTSIENLDPAPLMPDPVGSA